MSAPRSSAAERCAARAHELATERAVLREIIAQLEADERSLASQLASANEECLEQERRLDEAKRRAQALDEEIGAAEGTAVALGLELDGARRRAERAAWLARELERELGTYRGQISAARSGVEAVLEDMVRIKHKLHHATDAATFGVPREPALAAPKRNRDEEHVETSD
jgi:chromosome segregation ATPase